VACVVRAASSSIECVAAAVRARIRSTITCSSEELQPNKRVAQYAIRRPAASQHATQPNSGDIRPQAATAKQLHDVLRTLAENRPNHELEALMVELSRPV
jgi:hypothetical protein